MSNWSDIPYNQSKIKSHEKRSERANSRDKRAISRVAKVNKRIEKFEYKKFKVQNINDKKTIAKHDLGVVNLVFGIIFAIFLISFIVNFQDSDYSLPTFANFLKLINNIPQAQIPILEIDKSLINIPIIGDILGFFTQIGNAIIFLLNGVVQVVLFAFNILRWIFNL